MVNLRQQIIQENIENVSSRFGGIDEDFAFLRFAHSLFSGESLSTIDPSDLVDGGQDKQIDVITIDDDTDLAVVYIMQVKNTGTFSSNALILMRNGLTWLFNKSRAEFSTLKNQPFKDKIEEYRAIQKSMGPSNTKSFG